MRGSNERLDASGKVARLEQQRIDDLVAVFCDIEDARMRGLRFDFMRDALANLQRAWACGDAEEVVCQAEFIRSADTVHGLLKRVAADVVSSGHSGDTVAFAATYDRLVRLVEGTLSADCSTPDALT